jgi:hypothetical protein
LTVHFEPSATALRFEVTDGMRLVASGAFECLAAAVADGASAARSAAVP